MFIDQSGLFSCYNKHVANFDSDTKLVYIKTSIIVCIFLLIGLIWIWWVVIYTSPEAVFRAMLKNSLSTTGVTKTIVQEDQTGSLEQISQAHFGANNYVDVRTTISQENESGKTKIVTQTIGDSKDNYVRYTNIEIPGQNNKPDPDFSSLINVWGKQAEPQTNENVFTEAVFGAVLFGFLPTDKRGELLDRIARDDIYEADFDSVERTRHEGRNVYVYDVKIKTAKYIELLKNYDRMLGLSLTAGLEPDVYNDASPINVKITVDRASRNLVKLEYGDQARTEEYGGYGIHRELQPPDKPISRSELESKLQDVLTESQMQ